MMGDTSRPARRSYIDLLRGVAVLVMVLAHTSDAWTMADDRKTREYRKAIMIGGFGAPALLFHAGLTQSLAASSGVGVSSSYEGFRFSRW